MYISKVVLENFQSHSYSEFNLDKGLNTIVGISNVGKSSISRALGFVLFGSPWDKSFVRSGSTFTRITLETDTGIKVIREKGERINKYILHTPNCPPQIFENFGQHPPELIQQTLKIYEVPIGKEDSINLQLSSQLENLFMLSFTGSKNARIIGTLTGAHILDSAIRELNREGRSYSTEKGIKEKELVELQGQVDKFAQIERFSTEVTEIEARLSSVALQEGRLQQIAELLERTKAWKADWVQETAKEAALAKVDTSVFAKLSEKVDKFNKLYTLSGLLDQWKANFSKQNAIQTLLTSISLDVIPDMVQKVGRNKILQDIFKKITGNNTELTIVGQNLQQIEKQHEEAIKQYGDLLKQNGVCPICGVSTKDLTNV